MYFNNAYIKEIFISFNVFKNFVMMRIQKLIYLMNEREFLDCFWRHTDQSFVQI